MKEKKGTVERLSGRIAKFQCEMCKEKIKYIVLSKICMGRRFCDECIRKRNLERGNRKRIENGKKVKRQLCGKL